MFVCQVKKVKVEKRRNEIINRLNKTKQELFPDLREQREERDREDREVAKQHMREQVYFCVLIFSTGLKVVLNVFLNGYLLIVPRTKGV